MSPADLIEFTKVRLPNGTVVKALVEGPKPPVSRSGLLHMVLASALWIEEAEAALRKSEPKLARRGELLRKRLEDAMNRETFP